MNSLPPPRLPHRNTRVCAHTLTLISLWSHRLLFLLFLPLLKPLEVLTSVGIEGEDKKDLHSSQG